jgi:hypothetical protein
MNAMSDEEFEDWNMMLKDDGMEEVEEYPDDNVSTDNVSTDNLKQEDEDKKKKARKDELERKFLHHFVRVVNEEIPFGPITRAEDCVLGEM